MTKTGNISGLLLRAKLYGISEEILKKILKRDKRCIYCGEKMKIHAHSIGTARDKATIEHLNHRAVIGDTDVGICCGSCNSSRSNKKLSVWFKTKYCLDRNINQKTVAKPVKDYIKKTKKT